MPSSLRMLAGPLGIFFLSRVALVGAVEVARRFLILPTNAADASCPFSVCEPNGWVPLVLAGVAMAVAVSALWFLVRREDGVDAAGSAALFFIASPLALVLALDASAATSTALSLLALLLAPRHAWAAGLCLAGAAVFAPIAALMAPAVVIAAWRADFRGMRVNAVLAALPALVVLGVARGVPLFVAPWLQVQSLTQVPGSPGSLIFYAAIAMVIATCVVAFATGRAVSGLAGAPWAAVGLTLAAPAAAHLGAFAAAPWGPVAVLCRKWELEAPIVGALFMVQGLWLYHLVHAFQLV